MSMSLAPHPVGIKAGATKESLQVSLVGRWSCCPASN